MFTVSIVHHKYHKGHKDLTWDFNLRIPKLEFESETILKCSFQSSNHGQKTEGYDECIFSLLI
jgi:hypothetical protein